MGMYRINSFLSAKIETIGDSQHVTVYSTIHVNKEVKMPTTFSLEFSHMGILSTPEFNTFIKRFL